MPLDRVKSLHDYRALAQRYDRATRRINAVRCRAVAALRLRRGEIVIDVGCGTGFCFAPILAAIGPEGTLLAFDHSPELLAVARDRIRHAGWTNVVVVEATGESVDFRPYLAARGAQRASAVLFSYVHDIMQSEQALQNVFAQARPGARVAATSTRLWPRSAWPLSVLVNRYLWHTHKRYITARDRNFDQPWRLLARYLDDLQVRIYWPGWRYVAAGVTRSAVE